jgi:sulfide:quinone oxidoreductase
VAGGGVAALEACLALRSLAGELVHVTLVAPDAWFVHRRSRGTGRLRLAAFADDIGAELIVDRVTAVDAERRRAHTGASGELTYDALVLAVGAVPGPGPAGAVPGGVTAGQAVASVAFVVPPGPCWSADVYDEAVHAAVVRRRDRPVLLTLVTPEAAPMAICGGRVALQVGQTLAEHGIRVLASTYVRSIDREGLVLVPGGARLRADHVVTVPRLAGHRLSGLPHDSGGFVPVDTFGRVRGAEGVFAAGDCTTVPPKHASLAAEQADVAAAVIAAEAGAPVRPAPFKPILRCLLPARLRWYVEAPLTGGQGDATRVSPLPRWPSATDFGSLYLSPYLGSVEDAATARGGRTGDASVDNARSALRRLRARTR